VIDMVGKKPIRIDEKDFEKLSEDDVFNLLGSSGTQGITIRRKRKDD